MHLHESFVCALYNAALAGDDYTREEARRDADRLLRMVRAAADPAMPSVERRKGSRAMRAWGGDA